jgi:transposase-like protein
MESKTNGRAHRSATDWQEILDRFASSGRSLAAFCRTEGISRSTFDMWRRKLQPKKTSKKRAPREFVEVTPVSEPGIGGWTVEIELPDGRLARFRC